MPGFVDYGQRGRSALPLSKHGRAAEFRSRFSTNNYIVPLSIGPQLSMPNGTDSARTINGGGSRRRSFFTERRRRGQRRTATTFAKTRRTRHDWTSTWVAGGGVFVPIYTKKNVGDDRRGAYSISAPAHARYLRPGSIQDLPERAKFGSRRWRSETRLALIHIGVRLGL